MWIEQLLTDEDKLDTKEKGVKTSINSNNQGALHLVSKTLDNDRARLTIRGRALRLSARPATASTISVMISAKTAPTMARSSACLVASSTETSRDSWSEPTRALLAEVVDPGTAADAALMALTIDWRAD